MQTALVAAGVAVYMAVRVGMLAHKIEDIVDFRRCGHGGNRTILVFSHKILKLQGLENLGVEAL